MSMTVRETKYSKEELPAWEIYFGKTRVATLYSPFPVNASKMKLVIEKQVRKVETSSTVPGTFIDFEFFHAGVAQLESHQL